MAYVSKNALNNFLKKNKKKEDQQYTHTALPNPPESFAGSYSISENNYDTFLEVYYDSVFKHKNNAYLTEKHLDYAPILIDLDFRFTLQNQKRVYNEDFIKRFIKIYMKHIEKITKCDDIEIFILEKKAPRPNKDKQIVKDGIHIMIPDIITIPKYQYCFRHSVIHDPETIALIKELNPTNDINDIIDLCVIERNNWQLYGSMKPNNEPYLVTKIYNYTTNEELDEYDVANTYTDLELLKKLSLRNIHESEINDIYDAGYESLDKQYENMDGEYKARRTKKKTKKTRKNKPKNTIKTNYGADDLTPDKEKKELEKIRKLVNILNVRRIEDYTSWIELGWCLHNIDYRLLDTWKEVSHKSTKYEEGECEKQWETMEENGGLGIGTLHMWCKQDNPDKYKELLANDITRLIYKSLNGSHNDVAKVIYEMFKQEFVYGCSKNWYQFKNHRWKCIGDGIALKKKLSNELVNEYLKYNTELSNKIRDMDVSGDDDHKELELSKIDKSWKVISKLKTNNFKNSLMNECIEEFHNDEFEEKLDQNVNLLGFENGIYELDTDIFRDGLPDDYISFSTKINYEEFEANDEYIMEINSFMQQIQPKKSTREYVLTLLSSFLDGKISEEKFPIWTGTGGNGKSKLIELMSKSIGDYRCPLPISLLTQKRARSEACNPALAEAQGKRYAPFQEPDKGDRVNVGLMKELSGGDEIKVRNLYKGNITYKPQFKLLLVCNDLPEMDSDDGVWRRVRVVKFQSKFKENPDPKDPYQFPIDTSLSEKFDCWSEPFIYMLIQYYKKYKQEGLFEPDDIKLATENYKNDSDCFASFFNEKIELKPGANIHIDIAFARFKDWYAISFGSTSVPNRKDLKQSMTTRYGKGIKSGNVFKGINWVSEFTEGFIQDQDESESETETETETEEI